MKSKVRSIHGLRMLLALALLAASTAMSVAGPAQLALADAGGRKDHTFDMTFTKWVISAPANPSMVGALMVGVVGGDVGNGAYAGEVLSEDLSQEPGFWLANARYEFHGQRHTLIANVYVTQNNTTGAATITGTVTSGWLKGSHLTGEYKTLAVCSHPTATPGNIFGTLCFQGELHIQRPSEH